MESGQALLLKRVSESGRVSKQSSIASCHLYLACNGRWWLAKTVFFFSFFLNTICACGRGDASLMTGSQSGVEAQQRLVATRPALANMFPIPFQINGYMRFLHNIRLLLLPVSNDYFHMRDCSPKFTLHITDAFKVISNCKTK